jgi:hypothetical protein
MGVHVQRNGTLFYNGFELQLPPREILLCRLLWHVVNHSEPPNSRNQLESLVIWQFIFISIEHIVIGFYHCAWTRILNALSFIKIFYKIFNILLFVKFYPKKSIWPTEFSE